MGTVGKGGEGRGKEKERRREGKEKGGKEGREGHPVFFTWIDANAVFNYFYVINAKNFSV